MSFDYVANLFTHWAGSRWATLAAVCIIILWLALGPFCDFNELWQLTINTLTTVITFVMVFIIQHGQNREMLAVHVKLNELIRALDKANNVLLTIEAKPEEEITRVYERYAKLANEGARMRKDEITVKSELLPKESTHSAEQTAKELSVVEGEAETDKAKLVKLLGAADETTK